MHFYTFFPAIPTSELMDTGQIWLGIVTQFKPKAGATADQTPFVSCRQSQLLLTIRKVVYLLVLGVDQIYGDGCEECCAILHEV